MQAKTRRTINRGLHRQIKNTYYMETGSPPVEKS